MSFMVSPYVFAAGGAASVRGLTKLRQTSAQSITANTWTNVQFGANDHDNLSAVNLGSSNTNIVVPSGVYLMRARVKAAWDNNSGEGREILIWDGSKAYFADQRSSLNEALTSADAGWIAVTPGATLTLYVRSTVTRNLGNTGFGGLVEVTLEWASGFGELVGDGILGITSLRKTASQAGAVSTWTSVTWDVEDYDNLSAVDLGSSSTNIVVPTGITLMRPSLMGGWATGLGSRLIDLTDGTTQFLNDMRQISNEACHSICSGWRTVTPGATLTLKYNSGSTAIDYGSFLGTYATLTLEWASDFADMHP